MAQYRVGVIGCGGIGIQHATVLVGLDNACLVSGCDLNQETQDANPSPPPGHLETTERNQISYQ